MPRVIPKQIFFRLVADAGGDPEAVFTLHGDFYDPREGEAWQPYPLGVERPHEYITGVDELPAFDTGDGAVDGVVAQMSFLAKNGDRAATGLELHDPVAWRMVADAVMSEKFRRRRGEKS